MFTLAKMALPPFQPPLAITLRPETAGDEAFLLALYHTTREAELALTNWDAAARSAFVLSQFQAMRRGYATMFPHGQFSVVVANGQPVGRMVIDRSTTEFRVVDMALLPAHQNQQIGTQLMQAVQSEAAAALKPVCLHVLKMNRASRFYTRLGFVKIRDEGIYDLLEWRG
jgi:ribosomal protein S18 acetylase RimI-like enzyme